MGYSNVYGIPAAPARVPRAAGARIIDGKAIAKGIREGVRAEIASSGLDVGLATILLGNDPASAVYVAAKHKACAEVGITSFRHDLSADIARDELVALIDCLNADPAVSGILCQLPVPDHLGTEETTNRIDSSKDVDGLTIGNAGRLALGLPGLRPCTPSGVIRLLEETCVPLEGRRAVVIGRSNLFGKPMVQLLLRADATVVACHSRTRDLPALCRTADVLIAAAGRPKLVQADWIKPGATVIDVGINRAAGTLVGDVDYNAVQDIAGAITPVPGGVGPMTIACLLENTLTAARDRARLASRVPA
jgi:methylenetetrahydrofolate dehydrogenase (NADP+) / methenyltetrahydrofolate cyclohydrolase